VVVVSMSRQEFSRLDVLLRVQSGRLRVSDACVLIGLQRRQGHCQLKQRWYAPAVGGAVVRCGGVLGTPTGLSPSQPRGDRKLTSTPLS